MHPYDELDGASRARFAAVEARMRAARRRAIEEALGALIAALEEGDRDA